MVAERSDHETTSKNQHTNGVPFKKTSRAHYINFGEEDQMEITGYAYNKLKNFITWIFYILTFGILRLIFHWYPQFKLFATHSICCLDVAEKILIVDNYKGKMKTYFVKNVETLKANRESLQKSDSVISINGLIFSRDPSKELLTVYLCDGTRKELPEIRIIRYKKLIYVWDAEKYKFIKLSGLDKGVQNSDLHEYGGYNQMEQCLKRIVYGSNSINVPVQSILTLLILEALTPFYIFQLFSLIVWLAEFYYYYTIAILIMSVFGISTSIIQTRRNQKNLKGTVHSTAKVLVSRNDGIFEELPTTDLVPGDVIVIPSHGCEMPCDAVLLNGNCIVNESMLTGESVPITKTALPRNDKLYNVKEHSNHTLFCGTRVIQTRYYGNDKVLAVVIRTGYLTSKGQLVRSILYPPPADFKFDQDSYKFIMILTVIALLGFIYTIFSKYSRAIPPLDILIKALDIITIAIPPALPAAMTVGKLYALNRLKKNNIYCINSRVINVSGSVNCVGFDKTGTLTEDGLDMWGVVPIDGENIENPIKNVREMSPNLLLFQGMLTCHSLTIIDEELCGDPLDTKMFESTEWLLEEPKIPDDNNKYDLLVPIVVKSPNQGEIGIIQQYQFSSTLQRMSVVAKNINKQHFDVFCKGSPEMIISLCKPNTVPDGLLGKLKEYTEQGYRVIGMGTKALPDDMAFHKITQLHREDIECDLSFVGLIILENRLKPQTTGVIRTLHEAGMKIIMITGDNILTAVSVARECGIIQSDHTVVDVITTKPTKYELATIDYHISSEATTSKTIPTANSDINSIIDIEQERKYHLVVTGNSWANLNQYFPDLLPKIVANGVVFARMSGHQKQQLIEELQNLGYYVAMCGDGANDCGALKAAHVGISLSEAESSVASPFTSKIADISCTPKVIREGRAALMTSFGVFKLMLCYSLTEFASVIILYGIDANLTSLQFLFIDICLILNFASFFGNTKAHEKLHNIPPMTSLLSIIPLTSMILFMIVTIAFQIISYHYIQTFDWFTPFVYNPNETTFYTSYENYAVYTVSMFQYIIMAVIFSKGRPYRQAIYTNYIFLTSIAVMIVICCYITVYPANWIIDALELKMPPFYESKVAILVFALINLIICFVVEDILVEKCLMRLIKRKKSNLQKNNLDNLRLGLNFNQIDESNYQNGFINKGFDNTKEIGVSTRI